MHAVPTNQIKNILHFNNEKLKFTNFKTAFSLIYIIIVHILLVNKI